MTMSKIDNEYSRALFELCIEEGNLSECVESVELIGGAFKENPGYTELLNSPVIPLEERCKVIEKAFGKVCVPNAVNILKLMCRNGSSKLISGFCAEFLALCRDYNKEAKAVITSATELKESEKQRLLEKLEKISGLRVYPQYIIDESLISGVVISINGRVYDGSLKARLEKLKDVIKK